MKRRDLLRTTLMLAGGAMLVPAGWTPRARAANAKWRIGFSQATTLEPWRVQFNKDLKTEAAKHPEADVLFADAEDHTEKQVADMEAFISRDVDLILISPKESAGLTSVVETAMKAKIPVILLDRNINSDDYTQWIGGDNVVIGRAAGSFVVDAMGGPGKAHGNVVEIWGGLGTQGSHDRSDGFHAVADKEHGLKYLLKQQSADWKQDKAYEVMATALRNFEQIDLVYAHNDPMAYGAYLAAKDAKREKDIRFVGVDGLPNEGVKYVYDGILLATFLYPTPGAEGLRQGLKLLGGGTIEKKIVLPTATYTKANAGEVLKANGLI
jgi:ribose transport system substrate-binding protein